MRSRRLVKAFALLTICMASLFAGCVGPTSPIGLDEDVTLAPGERTLIAGTGLSVKFLAVANDSRCPADALCITGGDALVKITARLQSSEAAYDLHTGSMAPVQHGAYTIALVQLQPYPFSSRTIAPDEYRATLRVTR